MSPIFQCHVYGVITTHIITPLKRDDENMARMCVQHPFSFRKNSPSITVIKQDNVHTNTEFVLCISIVDSICPYKYNQWAV